MKKLIGAGLLLLAGCRSASTTTTTTTATPTPTPSTSAPTPAPGTTGAASPADAISAMMAAVKAEDLQAFGAVWGTTSGSVREQWSRSEFEMRAYYSMKCLRHDRFAVLNTSNAAGGSRILTVQITRGGLTKASNFTVVPGPGGRWFVEKFDPDPLTQICQS